MILALYGAGAMGREFKIMAEESGEWSGVVFIDDHSEAEELSGCPVCRFQMFRERYTAEEVRFLVSIGEPKYRLEAFERMTRAGYKGAVLSHSSAYISPDVVIGEGTVVCHDAHIGSLARIGMNCYISRNASVGHDAVVGDHTRLGVNSFVGGHTVIGTNAFIGAGALLKDRIRIGDASIVALGASVFEDVPDNSTVIGNPARICGEGTGSAVYSTAGTYTKPKEPEKERQKGIPERYWEVFADCFEGVDFNPVTFKYHDSGWDSVTHMMFIAKLEEAFKVSIKGREVMRVKSYADGLKLISSKLEKQEGEDA